MFMQANAFLQSRDGPATPDIAGSTPPRGAATKVADPDKKESNPVEALGLSSSTAVGGGGVGFPLPTVDSATVCLVGAAPCTVDLDLLDQEVSVSGSHICLHQKGLPISISRAFSSRGAFSERALHVQGTGFFEELLIV